MRGFPAPMILSRLYAPGGAASAPRMYASLLKKPDLRLYHAVTVPPRPIWVCEGPYRPYGKQGKLLKKSLVLADAMTETRSPADWKMAFSKGVFRTAPKRPK